MSVAAQKASREGFAKFRSDPKSFLETNALTALGFVGSDTYRAQVAFGLAGTSAKIGPENQFLPMDVPGMIQAGSALVTPMRVANVSATRLAQVPRFGVAEADLWLTVRLSGCTILILDWGGAFSMVHLQPFTPNTWNRVAKLLMGNSTVYREMTRYSLQQELSSIVAASTRATAPKKYILAQSQWRTDQRGVTGVQSKGSWTFYRQDYHSNGTVHSVEELQWTDWNHWGPYVAAAK